MGNMSSLLFPSMDNVLSSTVDARTKLYKINVSNEKLYYKYRVVNFILPGNPIENSKYLYTFSTDASNNSDMKYTSNPNYISSLPTYQYIETTFLQMLSSSGNTPDPSSTPGSGSSTTPPGNNMSSLIALFYMIESNPTSDNFCKVYDTNQLSSLDMSTMDLAKLAAFKLSLSPCPVAETFCSTLPTSAPTTSPPKTPTPTPLAEKTLIDKIQEPSIIISLMIAFVVGILIGYFMNGGKKKYNLQS